MTKQVFKEINQFALLAMITDTKIANLGLSVNERALLTALINFRNAVIYDKTNGFEAWPSIDTLTEYVGLSERTINSCKTSLAQKNFIKIRSGKGQGNNNHYFINARKIVECYNTDREQKEKLPDNRHYDEALITTTKQERNISGLKKGTKAGTNQKTSGLTAKMNIHCTGDSGTQDDPDDMAWGFASEAEEASKSKSDIDKFLSEMQRIQASSRSRSTHKTKNYVNFECDDEDDHYGPPF